MKKVSELKEMSLDTLQEELLALRKQQFTLRLSKANGSLQKTHIIKLLRRTIARVKTIMTEKVGGSDGK